VLSAAPLGAGAAGVDAAAEGVLAGFVSAATLGEGAGVFFGFGCAALGRATQAASAIIAVVPSVRPCMGPG
jgi:hypothetical protein